jgi:hypothetical protein
MFVAWMRSVTWESAWSYRLLLMIKMKIIITHLCSTISKSSRMLLDVNTCKSSLIATGPCTLDHPGGYINPLVLRPFVLHDDIVGLEVTKTNAISK